MRELSPTIEIWTDANLERCGAHSSCGDFFQRLGSPEEIESDPHINLLELRAAKEGLLNLASPGDRVRLFIDSTTAVYYVKKQGGTHSHYLAAEAISLWEEANSFGVEILTPHWISTSDNASADFLTRHSIGHWELRL